MCRLAGQPRMRRAVVRYPTCSFTETRLRSQSVKDSAANYYKVAGCPVCGSRDLRSWGKEIAKYKLVRCAACEFVCVGHRPTTEAIGEYYSSPSQYDGWEAGIEPRRKMWERRVRLLGNRLRGSVLDVGTGIGQFLAVARP